jgi:hypothetical protein
MTITTLTTKLGATKGRPYTRIWIEGKRLLDAGFLPGEYYTLDVWNVEVLRDDGDVMRVKWTLNLVGDDDYLTEMPRKVSGKGDRPVIDIAGLDVQADFGKFGSKVDVNFTAGEIVITLNEESAHDLNEGTALPVGPSAEQIRG